MMDSPRGVHDPRSRPAPKRPINIQDSFLFGSLKEGRLLVFALVTEKQIKGRLRRFDRYAVVVDDGAREILIYKHAIVGITDLGASP